MEKKYVIICLFIFLLVIGSVTVFKIVGDLNKENIIRGEIKEISKVFTVANIDDDNVNEILERSLIKKGDYADVERSIKQYYKNLYGDLKNLTFLLDEDNFVNYLSAKNIEDDGPNFLKSRSNLSNTKAQIVEYYDKFNNSLSSESYKISFFDSGLRKYYRDFYLELTTLAISSNFGDLLKQEYDMTLKNIDIYTNAFDFLYANKNEWKIESDGLKFNDSIIFDEYLGVIEDLNKKEVNNNES